MWIIDKIKNLTTKWRHFLVMYSATVDGGHLTGQMSFSSIGYANKEWIENWLMEQNKDQAIRSIVILNIIELNDTDYKKWMYKQPQVENKVDKKDGIQEI